MKKKSSAGGENGKKSVGDESNNIELTKIIVDQRKKIGKLLLQQHKLSKENVELKQSNETMKNELVEKKGLITALSVQLSRGRKSESQEKLGRFRKKVLEQREQLRKMNSLVKTLRAKNAQLMFENRNLENVLHNFAVKSDVLSFRDIPVRKKKETLTLNEGGDITVTVLTPTSCQIDIITIGSRKIEEIKEAINSTEYISWENFSMSFQGSVLKENVSLDESGIRNKSVLYIVVK